MLVKDEKISIKFYSFPDRFWRQWRELTVSCSKVHVDTTRERNLLHFNDAIRWGLSGENYISYHLHDLLLHIFRSMNMRKPGDELTMNVAAALCGISNRNSLTQPHQRVIEEMAANPSIQDLLLWHLTSRFTKFPLVCIYTLKDKNH